MEIKIEQAKRYNQGKLRHELIPINALNEIAKVYTNGAEKYTERNDLGEIISDGANNWRKGMSWLRVLASAKRHIAAYEAGEDFDPDPKMNTYHLANACWNLITLLEYYKLHPRHDDRLHNYLKMPAIGLDVDDVLAAWVIGWTNYHNMKVPTSWFFDRDINERFNQMKLNGTLDDFYLGLEPKISPKDIPFEPHCYITSRPVSTQITERWLHMHGFPARPVYTVEMGASKVDVAKNAGVEIFVDDRFVNFVDFNRNGICCYLFDANHNQRYDVGYKRIKHLKELVY